MKLVFSIVVAANALIVSSAVAGTVDDCRQILDPDLRLRACTEIIEQSTYSQAEKSVAYSSRGVARSNASVFSDALADFDASIRLEKANPDAISGRARTKIAAGDLRAAIADYDDAIRLAPGEASLYVARGHALTVSAKLDAAIRDLDQAVKLDPRSWSAYNERGVAYFRKGNYPQAERDFTQALSIVPLADIYTNRGRTLEAQGKKNEAINDLRRALLSDPSTVDAKDELQRLGALDSAVLETATRVQKGENLAQANCSSCHAIGRSGTSPNPKAPEFRNFYRIHPVLTLRESVSAGIVATHQQMPQFTLSTDQVDQVVAYMNSLTTQR